MRILLLLLTLIFTPFAVADEEAERFMQHTNEQIIVFANQFAEAAFCNDGVTAYQIDRHLTEIFAKANRLEIVVIVDGRTIPYTLFFYPSFDGNKDLRYMNLLIEELDEKQAFCYNRYQQMEDIRHYLSTQHAILSTILRVLDEERKEAQKDEGIRG